MPQTKFILACSECDRFNYITSKNRQNVDKKLELKKYCRWCKSHTMHAETRLRK